MLWIQRNRHLLGYRHSNKDLNTYERSRSLEWSHAYCVDPRASGMALETFVSLAVLDLKTQSSCLNLLTTAQFGDNIYPQIHDLVRLYKHTHSKVIPGIL